MNFHQLKKDRVLIFDVDQCISDLYMTELIPFVFALDQNFVQKLDLSFVVEYLDEFQLIKERLILYLCQELKSQIFDEWLINLLGQLLINKRKFAIWTNNNLIDQDPKQFYYGIKFLLVFVYFQQKQYKVSLKNDLKFQAHLKEALEFIKEPFNYEESKQIKINSIEYHIDINQKYAILNKNDCLLQQCKISTLIKDEKLKEFFKYSTTLLIDDKANFNFSDPQKERDEIDYVIYVHQCTQQEYEMFKSLFQKTIDEIYPNQKVIQDCIFWRKNGGSQQDSVHHNNRKAQQIILSFLNNSY